TESGGPPLHLTTKDLTPKFLHFYDEATQKPLSDDERWGLWKKEYGFAAVPPTPEGQAMARAMLDSAWASYPKALPTIRKGAAGLVPDPHETLASIAALLRPEAPVEMELLVYVGTFDDNAFTTAENGDSITVALPIESDPDFRTFLMTHEMTHAVH